MEKSQLVNDNSIVVLNMTEQDASSMLLFKDGKSRATGPFILNPQDKTQYGIAPTSPVKRVNEVRRSYAANRGGAENSKI